MIPTDIEGNLILKVHVGSVALGLNQPGYDDQDEMGIYIEPPPQILGVRQGDDFYIYRTQAEGVRSQPGDLDLTLYSLHKWALLAIKGNPQILMVLFAPVIEEQELGWMLRRQADMFISKAAGPRFLGYMRAQRLRLLGEAGQKHVTRQELVDKYGYDTKYAYHIVRLAYQGIELMETGKLVLPIPEPMHSKIMAIREGLVPLNDIKIMTDNLDAALVKAIDDSQLQERPDLERINYYMVYAHKTQWLWGER